MSVDPGRLGGLSFVADRSDSSGDIKKRTPLEQAIAEKTNRRVRYEAKLRKEGFKKTTVYVRAERWDEVKAFIDKVNSDPQGAGA